MSYLFHCYSHLYDKFMNFFDLDEDQMILQLVGTKPMQIADIGGGTGRTANLLISCGHQVTIFDPCIPMTKKATKRNPQIKISNLAMPSPLPQKYDVILLRDCLHHIKFQKETLQLCASALNPQGLLLISDFSPNDRHTKLLFLWERFCLERIWPVHEDPLIHLLDSFHLDVDYYAMTPRDYIITGRRNHDRLLT